MYWTSTSGSGSDKYSETLLVQGDDFAIFRTDSDWSEGGVSDHFALFSGIYYNACDMEMPTAEERQAMAGLWPLSEGAKVDVSAGKGASIEVGATADFYLMGKTRAAHSIKISYQGDDPSEESIIVLDEVPLTVAIIWDDSTRDTTTLVTRPTSAASTPVDIDLIGNCASLLNNQTNKK